MKDYILGLLTKEGYWANNHIVWLISKATLCISTSVIIIILLNGFIFRPVAKKKSNLWYSIIKHIQMPTKFLVWFIAISYIISDAVYLYLGQGYLKHTYLAYQFGLITAVTWATLNSVKQLEKSMLKATENKGFKLDKGSVDAICKLLKVVVLVVAALMMLQTLGVSLSALLTVGGLSGLALSFASKDMLSSFFGTLNIYLDKPFSVGDWIKSPDRQIEGIVTEINWRITQITTLEKRPIYIPNSLFSTIIIENMSRMTHRRINETISIRYADIDKVGAIVNDIRQMLIGHDRIDDTQTLFVGFNKLGDYATEIIVYTFTDVIIAVDFFEVKQDILLKIAEIVRRNGAELAFPTQTLHLNTKETK